MPDLALLLLVLAGISFAIWSIFGQQKRSQELFQRWQGVADLEARGTRLTAGAFFLEHFLLPASLLCASQECLGVRTYRLLEARRLVTEAMGGFCWE